MPSNLIVLEAVNLICGDEGDNVSPGESTHLELQELKLPGLEEGFVDHNAGGSMLGIEVPMNINRLEATFNLAGWKPEVMSMIARSSIGYSRFTAYGVLRDRKTGNANDMRADLWGRLGRVNPTAYRKGDLQAHEYAIRAITHYELAYQTGPGTEKELYYFDFFSSERRVGGIDLNKEINQILRIPGGTSARPGR